MAEENRTSVSLAKTIFNNKEVNDFLDKDFSQLIQNQESITIERLFEIYRELFYKLQKQGNNSHHSVILESQEYIDDYIYPRDLTIQQLIEKIGELEDLLYKAENPHDSSHPFYPNGTFLRSPARSSEGLPIWIMHNGVKREFKNYTTYKAVKL